MIGLGGFSAAQSSLRVQIQTQNSADCDPFRLAGYTVDCQVNPDWQARTPGRLINLCADADLEVSLAQILNVRPAFYTAEQAVGEYDGTSCLTTDISLILAQQGDVGTSLTLASTGVMPARLSTARGDTGLSRPPVDLSPYPVRLSFNRPDYAAFCTELADYWPRLSCNQNIDQGRNTIMVSCPTVPVSAVQQLANLFQTSFQTFEWRDDPAACDQAYAIDLEIAALADLPNARQIAAALSQPTLAILRGDLPPIAKAREPDASEETDTQSLAETWVEDAEISETPPAIEETQEETTEPESIEAPADQEPTGQSVAETSLEESDSENLTEAPDQPEIAAVEAIEQEAQETTEAEVPEPEALESAPIETEEVEAVPLEPEVSPATKLPSEQPEQEVSADESVPPANLIALDDPKFLTAISAYEGTPILLQFADEVDEALCAILIDLGLSVQCDTSVSETSPNLMLRCDSLSPAQARAFGAFLGLESPRLWDWRDRFATDVACVLPSAFEIELLQSHGLNPAALLSGAKEASGRPQPSPEGPPGASNNTPRINLDRVGPDVFEMGRKAYAIEVNADDADQRSALCGLFSYLGYKVACGTALTENRTNLMQICDDLPDGLQRDIQQILGLRAEDLRTYDWRERSPLAKRGCEQGPAFILEVHAGS